MCSVLTTKTPLGIKQDTQLHHDLILESRQVLTQLQFSINFQWAPSVDHSKADLENLVEWGPTPSQSYNMAPKTHVISVIDDIMILTAHLSAKLRKVIHYNHLRDKLKKDNSWTNQQFGMVDWQGYRSASFSLSLQTMTNIDNKIEPPIMEYQYPK
jgi:hypothetical protein